MKTALLFFAVKRYDVSGSTFLVQDKPRTGLTGEKVYRLQFFFKSALVLFHLIDLLIFGWLVF